MANKILLIAVSAWAAAQVLKLARPQGSLENPAGRGL